MWKKTSPTILISLIIFTVFLASFPSITLAVDTNLYIDPPNITGLDIGDTFQVNVTVSDVVDLYGWEFKLFYRNDVLNATSIAEGPFLLTHPNPDATTFFLNSIFTDTYNATHGLILAASSLVGVDGGVSGTGTLATVTFKIKGTGSSILHLVDTKLVDSAEPFGNLIPHTTTDGTVRLGLHDIAVTNTRTSKTIVNDTIVYINVTVENRGGIEETFNVTVNYDANPIQTQTVTNLATATTETLTFTWDTTPVPKGNYTITATATLPGDMNPEDNTYIDGWVKETIRGDLTGDGTVDIRDITVVAMAFGAEPGDPNWTDNADLDNNNIINIRDITTVALEFGKSDP